MSIFRLTKAHTARKLFFKTNIFKSFLSTQEFSKSSETSVRSSISKDPSEATISTLSNGIRVVSDNVAGHFSAFGVYIAAGSRYEPPEYSGVSHILDRVAFKSTENLSAEQIKDQVEAFGGNVMSHSSREVIQYQGTVYNHDLEKIVPLFAEIVQRPLFLSKELEEQKLSTSFEIQNIMCNPETYLPEKLHSVAYGNNSLGKPFICTPERLEIIHSDLMKEYIRQMYVPERIVIAASGAPHEKIVELAERYFGNMKSYSKPSKSVLSEIKSKILPGAPAFIPDLSQAIYNGGVCLEEASDAEFTQLFVALNGVSILQDEIFPLATLQALLGGGHSFSAGGPGKGIHSRLYRTVLNRYGWSNSCQAFNHSYRDSGLFGIMGACPPKYVLDMLHVIGFSLGSMCESQNISPIELIRAKNQLKNNLLMNLESRLTRLEDMGQQVLFTGHRLSPSFVCQRIEELTASDIAQIASKLMTSKGVPTVLGYGAKLETIERAHQVLAKFGVGK